MKLRNGFVSNSSSSSFIVAIRDNSNAKITVEADLEDYGKTITNKMDLIKAFMDNYGWASRTIEELLKDKQIRDLYNACLKKLEEGDKIVIGEFDSQREAIERYLCDHGIPETEGITIIENNPGF